MGRYVYRVAVYGRKPTGHPRPLLAFEKRKRWSYGSVPLGTLVGGDVESVVVGGQTFQYVYYGRYTGYTFFGQTASTCRSISLDLAVEDGGTDDGFIVYHQSTDPTRATVSENTIGSMDSTLQRGESWAFQIETGGALFYANGSASCWAKTPF